MKDQGSMSVTAILVLTVVVLGLMGAWLGTVFFVARQGGHSGPLDGEAPGHASWPEADAHPVPGESAGRGSHAAAGVREAAR